MGLDLLLSATISITTVFSGLWVLLHILERKKSFFPFRLLMALLISFGQATVALLQNPILNVLTTFLSIVISTLICYHCDKIYFVIYDTVILICSFLADTFSVLFISSFFNDTVIFTIQHENYMIIRHILGCIFVFFFCQLSFTLIKKKQTAFLWHETFFYVALVIGEIFVFVYIVIHTQSYSSGTFLIFFLIGCFALDIYIVVIFYRISIVRKTEKENALLQQQTVMQMEVYEDLQQRYAHSMRVIHDAKRHVQALEDLIQADHISEAQQYKKSLYQELNKLQPTVRSENQLLNVILNHALIKADQNNILIRMDIEKESNLLSTLSDIDLTVIVSNLLDNAIDATLEIPEKERQIDFVVKEKAGFLMIHVENPSKKKIQKEEKFTSTKPGHMGLGLKNINGVVQKYNGIFSTGWENGLFIASVTIPISSF